jgi:hypothetical protein
LTVNGVDRTTSLGGGWSGAPTEIDLTGYATPISSADSNITANFVNNGGAPTELQFQMFVEVLR